MVICKILRQLRLKTGRRLLVIIICVCIIQFIFCITLITEYISQKMSSFDSNSLPHGRKTPNIFFNNWTNIIYPLRYIPPELSIKTDSQAGNLAKGCKIFDRPKEHSLPGTQRFQEVTAGRSYVFSAFYDNRTRLSWITAIGIAISGSHNVHPRYCRMWFKGQPEPDIREVNFRVVREGHEKPYVAYIYKCPVYQSEVPYAVSFMRQPCPASPPNILPLEGIMGDEEDKSTFTVCSPPINNLFNNATRLIEFIEVHRLLGVDKFIFYNYSVGPDASAILKDYSTEKLAEVVHWPLPVKPENVHYFGQLASLNDCLYRNIHKSQYIIYNDLDEFIVPRVSSTYQDMMKLLAKRPDTKDACTYIFKNTFYRTDWQSNTSFSDKRAENLHLVTLLNTNREKYIFNYGQRSKYIANPRRVSEAGIHQAWECAQDTYQYNVPSKVALLHHYRIWDNSPDNGSNSKLDSRMADLMHKDVVQNIIKRMDRLKTTELHGIRVKT